MINDIVVGDITGPHNESDIVIGMNSTLEDVTGIGVHLVSQYPSLVQPIELGSVLSFPFKNGRYLHMIVCHDIGEGGWVSAAARVRFGLDFLWHTEQGRKFSIVQIGTGRVGKRDGADAPSIRQAIADSYLPVDLYVYEPPARVMAHTAANVIPLKAYRAWHPVYGEERIAA